MPIQKPTLTSSRCYWVCAQWRGPVEEARCQVLLVSELSQWFKNSQRSIARAHFLGASKPAAAPIVIVLVLERVGRARRDLTTYARDTGRATIKSRATRSIEDEDDFWKHYQTVRFKLKID